MSVSWIFKGEEWSTSGRSPRTGANVDGPQVLTRRDPQELRGWIDDPLSVALQGMRER